MNYSKYETGEVELTESDFSIYDVLESVVSNLYISASSKGLYLHYFIEDTLPHFYFGDSNRIQQILLHLISNAIKVSFLFCNLSKKF